MKIVGQSWRGGVLAMLACGTTPTPPSSSKSADAITARYERYLASQGQASASHMEHPELAIGGFRFFSIGGEIGPPGSPRYHAAISSSAIVGDDWGPLLRAAEAAELAPRIAWLRSPAALLKPGDGPSNNREDPQAYALIEAPRRTTAPDGTVIFVGWFGDPPSFAPYRLTITAPPDKPAQVEQTFAASLLPADADPLATARAALRTGTVARRRWALNVIGQARDRTALPLVIALLADPQLQSQAAMALGDLGDVAAVAELLTALERTADAEARLHMVTALSRLNDRRAVPVFAKRLSLDADASVRLEMLYGLEKLGAVRDAGVRPAIEQAATKDAAVEVRTKAKAMLSTK